MRNWLRIVCSASAVALCLYGVAVAGSFEDGQAAYDRGDYGQAVQVWRPLAVHGDARSEYMLGTSYDLGRGVPQNYVLAAAWYQRAADQGFQQAQANLGTLYASGRGVALDYGLAIRWWARAAS